MRRCGPWKADAESAEIVGRCDRSPPRREAHRGSSRTVFREGDIRCGPGDPSRTGHLSLTRRWGWVFPLSRPISAWLLLRLPVALLALALVLLARGGGRGGGGGGGGGGAAVGAGGVPGGGVAVAPARAVGGGIASSLAAR